ncbi:hypothetical protein TNCV_3605041 [Trichonephila clavipes]|nr:hypothetical protein TNCV_3605041 [Trichonephila clavipes]
MARWPTKVRHPWTRGLSECPRELPVALYRQFGHRWFSTLSSIPRKRKIRKNCYLISNKTTPMQTTHTVSQAKELALPILTPLSKSKQHKAPN